MTNNGCLFGHNVEKADIYQIDLPEMHWFMQVVNYEVFYFKYKRGDQ